MIDYQQPTSIDVAAIRPEYPGLHLQRHLTLGQKPVFLRCLAVDAILRAGNHALPTGGMMTHA